MFIKTNNDLIINAEHVFYFEILKYLNVEKSSIKAYMDLISPVIFTGTPEETKQVFEELATAISNKDMVLFDITKF